MTIEQLTHDSYYSMEDYHQITIDLIQETNGQLQKDSIISTERLATLWYEIDCLLEVFNPKYKLEIETLKQLIGIIDKELLK